MAVITLVRVAAAGAIPLSPDEAYYWVWSRALAPGYLDHPPMVALWIRLGAALAGDTALGVRLLAPLSAALGSVLLADAACRLFHSQAAGLRAAVLLNATLMLGAGAVTMTPDTPLLFFWTGAIWALARIASKPTAASATNAAARRRSCPTKQELRARSPDRRTLSGRAGAWWLIVGAAAGLGLDSKYTAALLGLGIALWLLTPSRRAWLLTPWPWLGGLLAVALFLPVVLWNADHGWASFIKQGGRTGDWAPRRALRYLSELVAGQIGLATPLVFALFAAAAVAAARRWRQPPWTLCAALILPGAAVFVQHALGDRVQANWVAVLYPGCALAAAGLAGRWWRPAGAFGLAITALVYLQAALGPLPLPRTLDPTLRVAGFPALAHAAASDARQHGGAFLASEEYGAAASLAWSAPGLPVLAAAPRWRLFNLPASQQTRPGLLLITARRREGPDPAYWQSPELLGTLTRGRDGIEAETYRLYRVTPRPDALIVRLPQPERTGHAAPDPR